MCFGFGLRVCALQTGSDIEQGFALHTFVPREISKVKEFLDSYDPNALEIGKETSDLVADGKSSQTGKLIAAAVSGQSHVARELLRSRADINARDSSGRTALSAAFCSPDCDIHMWFLLHAADQQRKTTPKAQEDMGEEKTRTFPLRSNDQGDIREDRTLRMLVTLLRGEGQFFTKIVDGFLKEAGSRLNKLVVNIGKLRTGLLKREQLGGMEHERGKERERERERETETF